MSADLTMAEASTYEAIAEAAKATRQYIALNGDNGACGFAWVEVRGVRSNSRLGKSLLSSGWSKSYNRSIQYWNPSRVGTQSVDALEAGAKVAASVIAARLGVDAVACSRLD